MDEEDRYDEVLQQQQRQQEEEEEEEKKKTGKDEQEHDEDNDKVKCKGLQEKQDEDNREDADKQECKKKSQVVLLPLSPKELGSERFEALQAVGCTHAHTHDEKVEATRGGDGRSLVSPGEVSEWMRFVCRCLLIRSFRRQPAKFDPRSLYGR
ncbi:hypothetical protein CRENBAI_002306 [Crenichthys baileyi]|uniref:Uncharacterized protein n=1 Tax=Crenichthys baileyi TaxID=28760 RepID=A0AAV9R307_9TELE